MDIQDLFDMFNDIRKSSTGILTTGEMLKKLEMFNDNEQVIFSNGKFFDGTYDSYRGYYEDLYLGFDDEDRGFNTVGNLKKHSKML